MNQLDNNISELKLIKAFYLFVIVNIIKHETTWSNQKQADNLVKFYWKAELVSVAKDLDDFWFGMKG